MTTRMALIDRLPLWHTDTLREQPLIYTNNIKEKFISFIFNVVYTATFEYILIARARTRDRLRRGLKNKTQ